MDNFMLEAEFEKSKVIDLIDSTRAFLFNGGKIKTVIWQIEPWSFTLQLSEIPKEVDLSAMMQQLYKKDEIYKIALGIEQSTKAVLLGIQLNERWFCETEKKKHEKPGKRQHPEDRLEA